VNSKTQNIELNCEEETNYVQIHSGGFREGPGMAIALLSLACRPKS